MLECIELELSVTIDKATCLSVSNKESLLQLTRLHACLSVSNRESLLQPPTRTIYIDIYI